MTSVLPTCRICGTQADHPIYNVREMMFGTREAFNYFQCTACGCLQITAPPVNLGQYYPASYYSFALAPEPTEDGILYKWFQKQRCRTAIFGHGYKLNSLLKNYVKFPKALFKREGGITTGEILRKFNLKSFSARFLDVGCGSYSRWLEHLAQLGFRDLTGVDPFIDADRRHGDTRIYKRALTELEGNFDVITFHHSLEHMPQQLEALHAARERLNPGGTCLVRIPIVSSQVWEQYGVNWVELDAPRHLFLHSVVSITKLGKDAGLELFDVVYDSLPFEFYGSEQYAHDIPLTDSRSLWVNPESDLFSAEEKQSFETMALKANAAGRGGRAGFYFRARS